MAALTTSGLWRHGAGALVLAVLAFLPGRGLPVESAQAVGSLRQAEARQARAPAQTSPSPTGSGGVNAPAHRASPSVVLISADGFRADYFDRPDLPNAKRVLQRGARARALIPVFPTLTFPNHYSLVTGLWPEHHGIVANTFLDPARNEIYSLHNVTAVTDGSWYTGEPIWVTAERQGMVAACYFWPGSEAAIRGVRPTIWTTYDGSVSNDARVDTVLEWLRLPDDRRPRLLTLYMSDVDSASHRHEQGHDNIQAAIRAVDRALGRLLDGIEGLPAKEHIVLVLTSDHGMADTSLDRIVAIDDLVDMNGVRLLEDGPLGNVHVAGTPARAREVRDTLNRGLGRRGRAYLRHDVPARLHYRASPRIGDVVIVMNEGYAIETRQRRSLRKRTEPFGAHGWDPALASMHAVFAVAGPGVREGVTVPAVDNVDVYPFLTELLGLEPAKPIDGRAGRIWGLVMEKGGEGR
jgi:predicted AlkP superfamily pyrophosphatase or phosphodiesterase